MSGRRNLANFRDSAAWRKLYGEVTNYKAASVSLKNITVLSLALFNKGFDSIWLKCSYISGFVFSSNRDYVNFH